MIYYLSAKQWPIGQAVKTLASHAGNSGSIPGWVTKKRKQHIARCAAFFVLRFLNGIARRLRHFANARVRIPHPKIDKLACQAQGVGIFAHRAKFPERSASNEVLLTVAKNTYANFFSCKIYNKAPSNSHDSPAEKPYELLGFLWKCIKKCFYMMYVT